MATFVPAGISDWTTRTTPSLAFPSVAWSPSLSLFAAVSYDGDASPVITSPDGVTWTQRTAGTASQLWNDVIWVDDWSLFVAVSDMSGESENVMTSADGTSWTLRAAQDAAWIAVAYSPTLGKAVAVSYNTSSPVLVSTDGTTWTATATSGEEARFYDIAWSEDAGVFVGVFSSHLRYSTDGTTWTDCTVPSGLAAHPFGERVIWAGDRFVVQSLLAEGGPYGILTSADGITWTNTAFTGDLAAFVFHSACWTGTTLVLLSYDTQVTTDDWTTFTHTALPVGHWDDVAWAEGIRTLVGSGTAKNGADAMTATFNEFPSVTGLDHLEGRAVAVTVNGVVVASPYNPAYTPIVVSGGTIELTGPLTGTVTVGLPVVTDIQTLDIETVNGTRKDAGILVNRIGLWLEDTLGLSARATAPSSSTSLDGFQSLPVVDEDGNATTTPVTGYREVTVDGVWTRGGRIFLRNVDPTPVTIHSIAVQGQFGRS